MDRGRVHSHILHLNYYKAIVLSLLIYPSTSHPDNIISSSPRLPSRLRFFSFSNSCLLQLKLLSNMRFSLPAIALFALVAATPSAANEWTTKLTKDLQGLAASTRSIWGPAGTITRVDGPLFEDNLGNFPVSFHPSLY